MALINWENSYSVKVKNVDTQHQKLFTLINDLYDAMNQGKGRDVTGKILDELVTYTKTHFAYEEQLLKGNGYPAFAAHKAEHDLFTGKVVDFQKQYQEGKASLALPLMTFLKDWLTNHIRGTDQKYSSFLNGKGVS